MRIFLNLNPNLTTLPSDQLGCVKSMLTEAIRENPKDAKARDALEAVDKEINLRAKAAFAMRHTDPV